MAARLHPFRQLLRRPTAVAAMVIIAVTAFAALFAYQLAPDDTPDANRIIVELGARPPGFKTLLLRVPAMGKVPPRSSFFSGKENFDQLIPVNGYFLKNDSLFALHYIDEGLQDTLRFGRAQLGIAGAMTNEALKQKRLLRHRKFYLGTDRYGRDILSRLLVGARVSLSVGFVAVLLSLSIGILLGSLAGYFRGWVDDLIMWWINILFAIPTLLLVFAITLTIGKGFWEIFVAIGLTMWVGAARLIRGQVIALRELEYVSAARILGLSNTSILFRHILPNIAGPVLVTAAGNFATAILIEAGLSFLGIGVQPPQPSWGLMIKEHYNFLLSNSPMLAIIPGLAIMLLVYAINVLGNALRDIFDVRA